MDMQAYQEQVKRTCATTEDKETLKLALIGMQGELGEIAEPLKKYLWSGHALPAPSHLKDEIGDLIWYIATLCNALGIDLTEAVQRNIQKLQVRYPEGFSVERSLNRANW
jgi:NTP pyrophosphatase (non-canonical NTP hydrolase)